ncbi:MAG: methyltransferase domain-containing protein [Proteobacteria bacterium]|nr:methyltransferase domain-containing protein [Pseudomonadota bacterium]
MPDISEIQHFYQTPLGRAVHYHLFKQIQSFWPTFKAHQNILGIGYTQPYLDYYLKDDITLMVMMFPQQGVTFWPTPLNLTFLAEEKEIPLPDQSIDFILIVHGFEFIENTTKSLREIWRVLKPEGRLLVITPNRRGLWARSDHTPFGYGQPYTMTQLSKCLKQSLFIPLKYSRSLYFPPLRGKLSLAYAFEKIGAYCLQKFSGVVCIEATKQVYAYTSSGRKVFSRKIAIQSS